MKKGIHPGFVESVISCACGNKVETRSIKKELSIEICSKCHPFFTGEQRLLDVAGRVEKFQKKFGDNWKNSVQKRNDGIKEAAKSENDTNKKDEVANKAAQPAKTAAKAKPVETKATETVSEAKPAEVKPAETVSEEKPAEVKPAETSDSVESA